MKKKIKISLIVIFGIIVLSADQAGTEGNTVSGGMDPFEVIILLGYLVGVFILLPLVIYTNRNESLFDPEKSTSKKLLDLPEFERNSRAAQILEAIEQKLTSVPAEDGTEMITITKGKQARFVKRGLNYINKYLAPTDALIKERVKEFEFVYNDRAKRVFTGSKWIIVSSVAIGVLFFMTGGVSGFVFIHALGIVFYVLSSRTTMYTIEKRIKRFSYAPGFVGNMLGGLFLANGTKHYVKSGDGPWKRDWETEGQMAMIGLFFMAVISMFLGLLAALLGVLNFIINYSGSFANPFKSDEKWFAENFDVGQQQMAMA
jgi:hypothetical protein